MAVVVVAALYICVFIVPKEIQFSYATTQNCVTWPTVLPAASRTVTSGDFSVSPKGGVTVGNVWLFATRLCAQPIVAPEHGGKFVSFAPFGGWIFRQALHVNIPAVPAASAKGLDKPVPTTKALPIALSEADSIHSYTLESGGKSTPCKSRAKDASLDCDIQRLEFEQGRDYAIELKRGFGGEPAKSILKTTIHTLTATAIIDGSIKPNETVYARPTEFSFIADKPLKKASVSVLMGNAKLDATTSVDESRIIVKLDAELEREKDYQLTVSDLEAKDGSTLTDPYELHFRTSGGPKVTGVSIGRSGVAQNAIVTVTFDQELSSGQDVSTLATLSGLSVRVTKTGSSISYALQGAALCTDFTLNINKGIESSYGIVSTTAWSYSSRTVCHTTTTYGYSVRGRALVAYNFGTSGPITMYVGAIHGNESSSSGILKSWIDDLEANPSLYNGKRVVVVPTINPDGLAAGTRTNSRGVNLNRNFPSEGWVKDINDTDGFHEGGGGSEPLSEPEALALANVTTNLHPRLLLSYHAVGSLVTGDPGGYSAGYAAKYASMVGYRDATGQSGTFDYDITGAYEDWTYTKRGIPSMVIELGSYGYYNFQHHQAAMRAMLN